MSNFPISLDDDSSLQRIDDNLSELGSTAINQLREAVFAIEGEIGLTASGSAGTLSNRLDVSINEDGTIKTSALSSVGLVTLPIDNAQVGTNAGIEESKLSLDYSTSDLHTRITVAENLLDTLVDEVNTLNSNLLVHISGGEEFLDGTDARHVASHIDINATPTDPRDLSYTWDGLQDKDGNDRSATTVAEALDEINTALVTHENAIEDAHPATAVTVDTSEFFELSVEANTVQKALNELDAAETLRIGLHRATMHDNGIDRTSRASLINLDGYSQNVVPPTVARAFHIESPATGPVDNNVNGDDLIAFLPDNNDFLFDSQFAQVRPGDIIRINYGTGFEGVFSIDEVRHNADSEWVVRINSINLCSTDGYDCYARIDRPLFTDNTFGVFACAAANNDIDGSILSSIIVGNPRGAMALGNGFRAEQLDGYHYNLYLNLYPTGDPSEKTINLPAIDVTGNSGTTAGKYTLDSVVQATNDAFRASGFSYRFIAFSHKGNFGIMLADCVDNAAFSIVNGEISGVTLVEGSFTDNVIGDVTDGRDALGLGAANAAWASPDYTATFNSTGTAANLYTKVIYPLKGKSAIVNGVRLDDFVETYGEMGDGYWEAEITSRVVISTTTVEVTYTIDRDLSNAPLLPGKTIVVAPTVDVNDGAYLIQDYGRFIIKDVVYSQPCGDEGATTSITVINGIHGTGDPDDDSSDPGLMVRLYFSDDSVAFNQSHVIDAIVNSNPFLRVHEVFIDENGHTFTHERARMSKQSGTASLLETSVGWSFRRVSDKLQGYRDDETSVNFHRYVRLYIIDYNSETGEYDGYIGQRVVGVDSITRFGRVTRSRKGVPARFYDHNNSDYIEVQYNEAGSTSTSITTPRYVDIEIFPSLSTNDEYFKLASVETNVKSVVGVVDEREFGTLSEKNFSTSAIEFIEAGDRMLHSNGVFYGLDYKSIDPNDSAGILFNGGSALVNGKVVVANNGKVNIPQVDTGLFVLFGICLDINGNFVPVILSSPNQVFGWPDFENSKKEMFVDSETGNTYLIRSYSVDELLHSVTDLVLLYIVNVSPGFPTDINSVNDMRRFIYKETSNITLTVAENDDGYGSIEGQVPVGNFNSFDQVKNWIAYTDHASYTFKLKGEFNINTMIDFSSIVTQSSNISSVVKRVILDGSEGCLVHVNSNIGINLNKHITIKNIDFRYEPPTPSSSGNLHLDADAGCIYGESSNLTGVSIINCIFKHLNSTERYPFINIKVQGLVSKVEISNNEFFDPLTSAANTIIGFSPFSTGTATLENVLIENNRANRRQAIALVNNYTRGETTAGGLACLNVIIQGNSMVSSGSGVIGYNVRTLNDGVEDLLVIRNNNVLGIYFMDEQGYYFRASGVYDNIVNSDFPNGTGRVLIEGNTCSTISTVLFGNNSEPSLNISNNNICLTDPDDLIDHHGFTTDDIFGIAAAQLIDDPLTNLYSAIITNNTIDGTSDYNFRVGIFCFDTNAIITGNNITGFDWYGIQSSQSGIDGYHTISNNTIFRNGATILSYIYGSLLPNNSPNGVIFGNIFDSTTIDNASDNTIIAYLSSINGNVNFIETTYHIIDVGGFSAVSILVNDGTITNIGEIEPALSPRALSFNIVASSPVFSLEWVKSLVELIPAGAKLVGLETDVEISNNADWSNGDFRIRVYASDNPTPLYESNAYDLTTSTSETLVIDNMDLRFDEDVYINLRGTLLATTNADSLSFTKMTVKYTF